MKKEKIGNKFDVDCEMNCMSCDTNKGLCFVAHRNDKNKITGYILLCKKCFEDMPVGYSLQIANN